METTTRQQISSVTKLSPLEVIMVENQFIEDGPYIVENVNLEQQEITLHKLFPPNILDATVTFGDWRITDKLDTKFPHCSLATGRIKLFRTNSLDYKGWKYGSYSDCKVHIY